MHRSFRDAPVNPKSLLRIIDDALRSPTAGNSQGIEFLVLSDERDRSTYWEQATDEQWRSTSARYAGFRRAPVIVLALCNPKAYTDRYSEDDKAASGLGSSEEAWPVPYWFGDAGMATMALLLGVEHLGLGAAFLGTFRQERAVLSAFGVPGDLRLFGTILIGHPDGNDHRSASLTRRVPRGTRLHLGHYGERAAAND
jgi:nitroreductase